MARIFEVEGGLVKGLECFPIQMLLSDGCYPADKESAVAIDENLKNPYNTTLGPILRKVRLVAALPYTIWKGPTVADWKAHGWTVTRDNV